ncbi:MAG: hypothetical protein WDW38_005754 [Sanguina aurantia]
MTPAEACVLPEQLCAILRSPDLASFLGLQRVDALHMPVPLSFVFVGLSGDGNMHANISAVDLQDWFSHLDHVLPHARVELSELDCQSDGHCSGMVHGRYRPSPVRSSVHLNFSCNVVVVKRKAVVQAFERAIHLFSRPTDPALESGAQQVDVVKMEAFADNFIRTLGLDATYSMLVLNPTWTVQEPLYGYRIGFSQVELELLRDKARIVLTLMYEGGPEPALPHESAFSFGGGLFAKPSKDKFALHDVGHKSNVWADGIQPYLQSEEDHRRALLKTVGKVFGAAAIVQAARVLRSKHSALAHVLLSDLTNTGVFMEGESQSRVDDQWVRPGVDSTFRSMHPAEDCLVSTWVSAHRWVMIDLTAGGFDWGPALGGDGVVHKHTVPSVQEHFSGVKAMHTALRAELISNSESEQAKIAVLDSFKNTRLPAIANRQYHFYTQQDEAVWRRHYEETLLQSELDVREEFALKHCHNQISPPAMCGQLKDEVARLRSSIAKLGSSSGSTYTVFKDHKWDIFGADGTFEEEYTQLTDLQLTAQELFLAEMAALLSRALRHVVAPPTAVWRHSGYLHDIASPFAKHVHFNLYVISDTNQFSRFKHGSNFDVEAYRAFTESLRLSHQEFSFTVHQLNLLDDPALAVGMASAIKTTHQEIPHSNMSMQFSKPQTTLAHQAWMFDLQRHSFESRPRHLTSVASASTQLTSERSSQPVHAERVYIDSQELAHHLRHQFEYAVGRHAAAAPATSAGDGARSDAERAASHHRLEVPVFIFQLDRDVALLIDAHYNAKALEDMILVVQNAARQDEHPIGMMCGGSLLARPLSALKEALAATLQYLGVVLPPHLGYDAASHTVTHDWLWSVGAHPLSFTSTGVIFTQTQRDALGRSYLLDALDSSVELVNKGISALRHTPITLLMLPHILRAHTTLRDLTVTYADIVHHWRGMVTLAGELDWGAAASGIDALEKDVRKFEGLVDRVTHWTEPLRCKGRTVDWLGAYLSPVYIGSAVAALGALLFAAWPVVAKKPSSKVM